METREFVYTNPGSVRRMINSLRAQGFTSFEQFETMTADGKPATRLVASKPTPVNAANPIGLLTWWTLPERDDYDVAAVKHAATDAKVPQWMIDRVCGRNPKSAWLAATQLGTSGRFSPNLPTDSPEESYRYVVRNAGTDARIIAREALNEQGKRLRTQQVAVVYLENNKLTSWVDPQVTGLLRPEVDDLLADMSSLMAGYIGKGDDSKLRSILLDWLESHYRVCLRNTGGLYLIPSPVHTPEYAALVQELQAIRKWITGETIGGVFSFMEAYPSGANTVEDFIKSAVDELKESLNEVNGKLDDYSKNLADNPGARGYSAEQMLNRLGDLSVRAEKLEESLGEQVGTVRVMLDMIVKRATKMSNDAAGAVAAYRADKKDLARKAREAEAKNANPDPAKKSGTAKDRFKARKL